MTDTHETTEDAVLSEIVRHPDGIDALSLNRALARKYCWQDIQAVIRQGLDRGSIALGSKLRLFPADVQRKPDRPLFVVSERDCELAEQWWLDNLEEPVTNEDFSALWILCSLLAMARFEGPRDPSSGYQPKWRTR